MVIDLVRLLNKELIITSEEMFYILEDLVKIEIKINELTYFDKNEIRNLVQTFYIGLNYIIIFRPLG